MHKKSFAKEEKLFFPSSNGKVCKEGYVEEENSNEKIKNFLLTLDINFNLFRGGTAYDFGERAFLIRKRSCAIGFSNKKIREDVQESFKLTFTISRQFN